MLRMGDILVQCRAPAPQGSVFKWARIGRTGMAVWRLAVRALPTNYLIRMRLWVGLRTPATRPRDTRTHGLEQQAVGAGFYFCEDCVALGDDADIPGTCCSAVRVRSMSPANRSRSSSTARRYAAVTAFDVGGALATGADIATRR